MTKPTKVIVDCSTGEQTVIELTAEEIAEVEAKQAEAALLAQSQAKAAADKAALLEKLGITEDEARLLLG